MAADGEEGEEGEAEMSESEEESSENADGKANDKKNNSSPKLARQESLMRLGK